MKNIGIVIVALIASCLILMAIQKNRADRGVTPPESRVVELQIGG